MEDAWEREAAPPCISSEAQIPSERITLPEKDDRSMEIEPPVGEEKKKSEAPNAEAWLGRRGSQKSVMELLKKPERAMVVAVQPTSDKAAPEPWEVTLSTLSEKSTASRETEVYPFTATAQPVALASVSQYAPTKEEAWMDSIESDEGTAEALRKDPIKVKAEEEEKEEEEEEKEEGRGRENEHPTIEAEEFDRKIIGEADAESDTLESDKEA